MVDQDHTHHFGGERIEVPAVLPFRFPLVQQPQIQFVDENGSLQKVSVTLPGDIGGGHLA